MSLVLDYAWARPSPADIVATDAVGVMRYLGHDTTGKVIDAAELAALRAAGLGVGLVFEDTADRPLAGWLAGWDDAGTTAVQARALGIPFGSTIYVAIDTDPTPAGHLAVIDSYLAGWQTGLDGYSPGVYGGYDVLQLPRVANWHRWQTRAWSHGLVAPRLDLYQHGAGPLDGTDANTANGPDWGQIIWPATVSERRALPTMFLVKLGGTVYLVGSPRAPYVAINDPVKLHQWQTVLPTGTINPALVTFIYGPVPADAPVM